MGVGNDRNSLHCTVSSEKGILSRRGFKRQSGLQPPKCYKAGGKEGAAKGVAVRRSLSLIDITVCGVGGEGGPNLDTAYCGTPYALLFQLKLPKNNADGKLNRQSPQSHSADLVPVLDVLENGMVPVSTS